MTDFEAALQAQLERNAEFARQREQAEAEMDRAKRDREEAERRAEEQQQEERNAHHAALAERLADLVKRLKAASPDSYIVRTGWTESGEEFLTKVSTRQTRPARSLLIELDRDDDQVLARWITDIGNSVELWRLLEVSPELLTQLILQVADEELWRSASSPPPFPR